MTPPSVCSSCNSRILSFDKKCKTCLIRFGSRAKSEKMTKSERIKEAKFLFATWSELFIDLDLKKQRIFELMGRNMPEAMLFTEIIKEIEDQEEHPFITQKRNGIDPYKLQKRHFEERYKRDKVFKLRPSPTRNVVVDPETAGWLSEEEDIPF